jgi:hypothetical protein
MREEGWRIEDWNYLVGAKTRQGKAGQGRHGRLRALIRSVL